MTATRGVAAQGQDAVVGDEDHRLLREASREVTLLRGVEVDDRRRLVLERRVEQPQLVLLPEHPQHRPVDERLVDLAEADPVRQRNPVGVAGRQLDVDTGLQGLARGVAEVTRDVVQEVQERHAEVVGDDRAVEAPLVPQEPRQDRGVGGDRYAVDLGVGVHDRARAAVEDRHLERHEQDVRDLTGTRVHGREVAARLGARVARRSA